MNTRKPFAFLLPALSTLIPLAGCLMNSTHQEDPIPGVRQSSYGYSSRHGQLIVRLPRRIESLCSGDRLVMDTVPGRLDSSDYSLSGDTLELDDQTDSSNYGAVIQYFLLYGRVGSGTGLPGLWRKGRSGYKVVSGQLASERKTILDSFLVSENLEGAYRIIHLRVSGDSMEVYFQMNSAGLLNADWTNSTHVNSQPDSLRWDMDFRIIDPHTVEYHGRQTGETVRVVHFDNFDTDYSSDNPSHHPYHYNENPETCPDEYEPEWYSSFQSANAKAPAPLPKAQIPPNSAKRGYPVATPLKFRGFFLN